MLAIRFLPLLLFAAIFVAQLFTLQHCATPTPPSGGARDTLGPVLIVEETTPNFQTNYRPEEIILTFDEWVELDPKQEILISPPLELGEDNRPTLKRRSLIIPLQGLALRDSVTYVINIGSAIIDLNEGNPTENLRFVFATGPVLDTATVSGTLVRDYTGEPLEKGTFALFSNLADTAITSENPTYFAQTDEEGNFTVYNIRPGIYRALALERNPSATNYFIDQEGFSPPLAIGFTDSLFVVADGNNSIGTIQLSTIPRPLRINNADTTDLSRIKLVLNQSAEGAVLEYSGNYLRRDERDTINLFYQDTISPDTFFLFQEGAPVDTLAYAGTLPEESSPIRTVSIPNGRINPEKGLRFVFNRPVTNLDTSLITIKADTTKLAVSWLIDSLYPGEVVLLADLEPTTRYQFTVLPGAISGWGQSTSVDTLQRNFTLDPIDKYGLLRLDLKGLDSTEQYLLQLVLKEEVIAETKRIFSGSVNQQIEYRGLQPGTYQVELITDLNLNGRYDAGNIFKARQPEPVQRFPLEELRANWELEEVIDLSTSTNLSPLTPEER